MRFSGGCTPDSIQVFYNDEHALTLGVRQISVKTSSGTTTTNYPVSPLLTDPGSVMNPDVGATEAQGGTDTSGRPMFPALFITDLDAPPGSSNELAGDWQYGGTGIPPTKVFGTWKAATKIIDQTRNPPAVTVTPDNDPAVNNWNLGPGADPVPPGLVNQGYGVEIRWDINTLNLIPGHRYRVYFMLHDGDQNKTGGDAGQSCGYFAMPGPAPTPTPTATASPTPTPSATATATPTPAVVVTSKTFSGKTVTITFQNQTTSAQVLTALAITWPQATNGNLNNIKLGGTTIYNTPTGGGSLSTSSLLGTTAQRTIAAGASATLTFNFANNVNTTASNYTGSATFNPLGSVTTLP